MDDNKQVRSNAVAFIKVGRRVNIGWRFCETEVIYLPCAKGKQCLIEIALNLSANVTFLA